MKSIPKIAAMNAALTALYIALVASGLFYTGSHKFGDDKPTFLIPVFMLMLLVFSATVTGSLMLGRPILWYVDGKKKEAVQLLAYTVGFFFVLMVIVAVAFVFFA